MGTVRDEIILMIQRYENKVRGITSSIVESAAHRHGDDVGMLTSRKNAYTMDMIPDLKRLLELCPAKKTATIIMKFDNQSQEEYPFGTFDFNTPLERRYVNEMAMQIRNDRFCETEVRVNE